LYAHYLLASRAQITQKDLIMKRYSLLLGIMVAAVTCSSLVAQEKTDLQPNATVLSILTSNAGKGVELHLRSGEKMGGKVAGVTDNVVHLSHLTGAEFFDRLRRCERHFGSGSSCGRQIGSRHIFGIQSFGAREYRLPKFLQDCQGRVQLPILRT
jgi:hypothetical protein